MAVWHYTAVLYVLAYQVPGYVLYFQNVPFQMKIDAMPLHFELLFSIGFSEITASSLFSWVHFNKIYLSSIPSRQNQFYTSTALLSAPYGAFQFSMCHVQRSKSLSSFLNGLAHNLFQGDGEPTLNILQPGLIFYICPVGFKCIDHHPKSS